MPDPVFLRPEAYIGLARAPGSLAASSKSDEGLGQRKFLHLFLKFFYISMTLSDETFEGGENFGPNGQVKITHNFFFN